MEPQAVSKVLSTYTRIEKRVCPEHGPYDSTSLANLPWSECPVCQDIKRQAELEAAEAKHAADQKLREQRVREKMRRAAGLGRRYQGKGFDDFDLSVSRGARQILEMARHYADNFAEMLAYGRSMIMAGSYGTGKTHLASAIVEQVINQGHSALITGVYDLLLRLKATWSHSSLETEEQVFKTFTGPDLLVVDEVGVQFGSETEKTLLFQVFNKRYMDLKPTIVVSNEDARGLENFLGERIFDRLRENGGQMLIFDWPSARRSAGSKPRADLS